MLSIYKHHFAQELSKYIDLPLEEILAMIEIPPENIPGDLAFPCFQLAKKEKKSPNMIAQDGPDEKSYFAENISRGILYFFRGTKNINRACYTAFSHI